MNAIILAAGKGGRLGDATTYIAKPLTRIMGIPIIERQIIFLKEVDVADIYIVTGYLSGQFDYLRKKYGVNLLNNEYYATRNNIYSLYIAKDYFSDSFILEGDVFLHVNFLEAGLTASTYFTGPSAHFDNEWVLAFDADQGLTNILLPGSVDFPTGSPDPQFITTGVSYWTNESAELLKRALVEKISRIEKDSHCSAGSLFWDHIVVENMRQLNIKVKLIASGDWFEIDTWQDYERLQEFLSRSTKNIPYNLRAYSKARFRRKDP